MLEEHMLLADLWKNVKGQSILGEDDFAEGLLKYVRGVEDVKEIPKNQRYVGRPALSEIFNGIKRDKKTRATAIRNAVYEHGYSQKEIADFLGIHYSTISRWTNRQENALNNRVLNSDKIKFKRILAMKGKASLLFDWKAMENGELKAQAKKQKTLGKQ